MLLDQSISKTPFWDHGIAAQSILLGATERGLGGCMFGNVNKELLRRSLEIGEQYEILQVIALGKPKEEVRLVPLQDDGDIKYYRDSAGVHYVPKRSLDEIILA
jgi:nitroreductase